MKRGRKPKPRQLKILQGNPGKRPLPENEPEPDIKIPECPRHLSNHAKKEWARITVELFNLGILAETDRAALAAYCQCWGRWVQAENRLKREGLTVTTAFGNVIQNPLVGIVNTQMELMRKFLTEFGLSPSSRTRVQVPKGAGQSKNPFEALKGGKGGQK